ncbi:MAG: dihydropteroate synthase, partial [Spirochaetales bacterium]|nr:dihydropteroate synthase [Spirochaetales bacterium]
KAECDTTISIDTYKSRVAEQAILAGADIVNNVRRAEESIDLLKVAKKYDKHLCIMHNQDGNDYDSDIIEEIIKYFRNSIEIAKKIGITDDKIILDPGIGFGKSPEQNIEVMARLKELRAAFPHTMLLGTSRKSMFGHIIKGSRPEERVIGTVATTVLGVNAGFEIIRVHDVKENIEAALVTDTILRRGKK